MAQTAVAGASHGPSAPLANFPSHTFQRAPRWHAHPQLSFHFGLLQPALFRGFNAAVDLRWGPLLVSYSHGHGLDYSATPSLGLTSAEASRGMILRSPWTTGGGVGVVLLDELWVMVDVKVHRYEVEVDSESAAYSTVTVGGELGWRFFAWRGFFVQPMLRFWPNVHTTLPENEVHIAGLRHRAKNLGLFANVSVGWAFDL